MDDGGTTQEIRTISSNIGIRWALAIIQILPTSMMTISPGFCVYLTLIARWTNWNNIYGMSKKNGN